MSQKRQAPITLVVDLEYPEDLHNLHNDYPLAPERVKMRNVEKKNSKFEQQD